MPDFYEGPPLEPIEKISEDVKPLAKRALEEIENARSPKSEESSVETVTGTNNINLEMPAESSTHALTDLKIWLRDAVQKSPEADENIMKIMYALRDAHFAMDDERVSVREKINDITGLIDQFISNPNNFRQRNRDLTQQLINFCERLSQ